MQSRVRSLLIVLVLVGFGSSMPLAHHSVSGEFDLSKTATLKGVISRLDWINPHIYIYLDVSSHLRKPGTGDSVAKVRSRGSSRPRFSTTCLIRE